MEVQVFYDLVCPYAYIATRRLTSFRNKHPSQISLKWRPTLLGGIYHKTQAPQGKSGSASDVMPEAKRAISSQDLQRQIQRHGVPLSWHPKHPLRTLDALRVLVYVKDQKKRELLTHILYKAYWVDNLDLTDRSILLRLAQSAGVSLDSSFWDKYASGPTDELALNTDDAVKYGAPGVPFFVVNGKAYWGQDRLHFVEREVLGSDGTLVASLPRAMRSSPSIIPRRLTFFYDFSSPWAYIGNKTINLIIEEAGPGLIFNPVPILLGALFKSVGTPNLPMGAVSENRRNYAMKDLMDWCEWWGIQHPVWPSIFPIRSVLPLRVCIVEPSTRDVIYSAAWEKDLDVSKSSVLIDLLTDAGFNGAALVRTAEKEEWPKKKLIENTNLAVQLGLCGVPSYRVDDGPIIWGQDRTDVVMDYLAGWKDELGTPRSAL